MQDLQNGVRASVTVNEVILKKMTYDQLKMITVYITVRLKQEESRMQLPEYQNQSAIQKVRLEMMKLEDAMQIVTMEMHMRTEGFYKMLFGG